jgi:hypothetical protein
MRTLKAIFLGLPKNSFFRKASLIALKSLRMTTSILPNRILEYKNNLIQRSLSQIFNDYT